MLFTMYWYTQFAKRKQTLCILTKVTNCMIVVKSARYIYDCFCNKEFFRAYSIHMQSRPLIVYIIMQHLNCHCQYIDMQSEKQEIHLLSLNLSQSITSETRFGCIIPFNLHRLKADICMVPTNFLNQFPQQKQICMIRDGKNSFELVVSLATVNQLDSYRDTYKNCIKTFCKINGKTTIKQQIKIINSKQSEIIKCSVVFQNKLLQQNEKIIINFGSAINTQICMLNFKMSSQIVQLTTNNANCLITYQGLKHKTINQHQKQHSKPFNFNIARTFQAPNKESLPKYEAPILQQIQKKQLYICHDMAGGYREDINNYHHSNPISYRFKYLSQCCIFNYFSHHAITIPPMHWRNVCRKYNVKCLGTFIIEGNKFPQICNWLVYLAKKYRFDGYLINIEVSQIKNIKRLHSWLNNLTQSLHDQIPYSVTVWYDCISAITGKRQYQNCLSAHNIFYLSVCDFYFTNYWWKDELIAKSAKFAGQKEVSLRTFVGNDCFGRNTYGGGKENIFIAANKLLEQGIVEHMSIALFAPGYAYQGQGQINRFNWLSKQAQVFNGLTKKTVELSKKSWIIEKNGGNGWKYYQQQAQTSHQWCVRSYEFSLQQFMNEDDKTLHISFTGYVGNNGKIGSSPYKIFMQFYDKQNNFIMHENGNYDENQSLKLLQYGIQQQFIQSILISTSAISPSLVLRVVEMGKQLAPTGSNNGPYFKKQQIHFMIQTPQRNWISRITILPISKLPFITNFNMGHGEYFYFKGEKHQREYGYMRDMDMPHVLQINPLNIVVIDYNQAYIGGTSLKVLDNHINLIDLNINEKTSFVVNIICKGILNQPQLQLINKQQNLKQLIQLKQTKQEKKWVRYQSQQIIANKGIITMGIIANNNNFNIGQLIISRQSHILKPVVKQLCLYESINKKKGFEVDISFNIQNLQQQQNKVLLVIPSIFAGFIYGNSQEFYVFTNIQIKKFNQSAVKIQIWMQNDAKESYTQIYSQQIEILKGINIVESIFHDY